MGIRIIPLDSLKFILYNVDILIKEKTSYERIRSRIAIDRYRLLCYSCKCVLELHPYLLRRIDMGFYEELDQYDARAEYEEWLDNQEDDMVRLHEQEMSPEVVE